MTKSRKSIKSGFSGMAIGCMVMVGMNVLTPALKAQVGVPEYSIACDRGDGDACFNLGLLYYEGWGLIQDRWKGMALFTKGCDRGSARACYNLGAIYANGDPVGQDPVKAKMYMRRALSLDPGYSQAKQALAALEG